MTYDLFILHVDVMVKVDEGFELREIDQPDLEPDDVELLVQRLPEYGYELETEDDDSQEFLKHLEGCPILLRIYKTEVALSVPSWEGDDVAIIEACQDAAELSDADSMVTYDPQTDEWVR